MEYPSSNPNAALSDIPERTEPDTSEVESSAAAHKTIDSVNTKHVDFDSGVHDYDGDEDTGRVKTDRRLSDAQHRRGWNKKICENKTQSHQILFFSDKFTTKSYQNNFVFYRK